MGTSEPHAEESKPMVIEATIESMRLKGFFAPISARSAARADIRDAIEEIGMLEKLAEVCGRIAAAKARRAELVAMFKGLRL
jgi:hypothetical protein